VTVTDRRAAQTLPSSSARAGVEFISHAKPTAAIYQSRHMVIKLGALTIVDESVEVGQPWVLKIGAPKDGHHASVGERTEVVEVEA
jgi:hypothetical protein